MIIQANEETLRNWHRFRALVGNFEVSRSLGVHHFKFSLDENIGDKYTVSMGRANGKPKMEASALIELIGAETFKNLVENIWNPNCFLGSVSDTSNLTISKIVDYAFDWDKTPQGDDYWIEISEKVEHARI